MADIKYLKDYSDEELAEEIVRRGLGIRVKGVEIEAFIGDIEIGEVYAKEMKQK